MSPPLYEGFSTRYIHVGAACSLPQWFLVLFASLTLWFHSLAVGVCISRAQLGFRAKDGNGRDGVIGRIGASCGNSGPCLASSRMSHGKRTQQLLMSSSTVAQLHLALAVGSLAHEDEDDYVDTCSSATSIHSNTVSNWLIYLVQRNCISTLQLHYTRVYRSVKKS